MKTVNDNQSTITYEQPVNEQMRICLRLEYLFNQLNTHRQLDSDANAKSATIALARIVDVIDRPDLKSKLTQTLTQHASTLAQLQQFNQVDPQKLQSLLAQLDGLIDTLHRIDGKMGAGLRQNEFLSQVRLQLNCPWGVCHYNAPAFSLWLRKESQERKQDLADWAEELKPLDEIASLILHLTRNSTNMQIVTANKGLYQQTLNPNLPCHMIQVTLPTESQVYPEVSASKHRVIIRLLTPDFNRGSRAKQLEADLQFALNCCRL